MKTKLLPIEKEEKQNRFIEELKEVSRPGIPSLIEYLQKEKFFDAPASATHHLNYEGGLLLHSLNVFELLREKNRRYELDIPGESIIVTGLLHDLCKIDLYQWEFLRWTKDDKNQWQRIFGYKKHFELQPWGHGSKSVILAQKFIQLTDMEIAAILYHMGPYTNRDSVTYGTESYNFLEAAKTFPLVDALFMSDYEATNFLERGDDNV